MGYLIIECVERDASGEPRQAEVLIGTTVLVANCAERPLEQGRAGDEPVREPHRQPVQQQIDGTRGALWGRSVASLLGCAAKDVSSETTANVLGSECHQICLARERRVDRLELSCCIQEGWRRV